jgi:hypothetical protein
METAEVVNVIDDLPPTCVVDPLPPETATPDFTVSWTAHDPVGELASSSIWVSEDGALLTLLAGDATASSLPFHGQRGRQYAFLCAARDTAGNAEVGPAVAEARTRVVINRAPRCDLARPTPAVLWPPDHRWRPVAIAVSDPDGDPVHVRVTGVTQDEPPAGRGCARRPGARGERRAYVPAVARPDGALELSESRAFCTGGRRRWATTTSKGCRGRWRGESGGRGKRYTVNLKQRIAAAATALRERPGLADDRAPSRDSTRDGAQVCRRERRAGICARRGRRHGERWADAGQPRGLPHGGARCSRRRRDLAPASMIALPTHDPCVGLRSADRFAQGLQRTRRSGEAAASPRSPRGRSVPVREQATHGLQGA